MATHSLIGWDRGSFAAKGVDRCHPGGPARRVDAEDQSDGDGHGDGAGGGRSERVIG